MDFIFVMSHALTPYYKRIIRRQISTGRFSSKRKDLEKLLLEGLHSGKSKPMTAARKKQIYKRALTN
jgi:hypothetical protein